MVKGKEIIKCLSNLGYRKLTKLQVRAFETIAKKHRSAIIIAPTGTGKTEAAIIPIAYEIWRRGLKPVSAVYITPLRALNRDIEWRIRRIAECFGIRVGLRHGDTPQSARRKLLSEPPHILVTTPETFNYLLISPRMMDHLRNTKYIIIDELRELVESKRGLLLLLNLYLLEEKGYLNALKITLSATLKNIDVISKLLFRSSDYEVISDRSGKEMRISIIAPECSSDQCLKLDMDYELAGRIKYIVENIHSRKGVLVFTNTRSIAEKLGVLINESAGQLGYDNVRVEVHHGSLSRTHRVDVEKRFKGGIVKGLIATSSMELGIDIGYVDYVIQYMSPRQVVRLVQRIGRSGHKLGGVSKGSIIVSKNIFQILESIAIADYALKQDIEGEEVIRNPLDVLAYSMVLHAIIEDKIDLDEFYTLIRRYILYKDMDREVFDDIIDYLCYARLLKCSRNKNIVYPTGRSKLYIYLHTMIPDTRDIPVIDVGDNRVIGVLNEEYIVLNISPGDIIVLGGKPWRVIEYDDLNSKIYVEKPGSAIEVLIPHWEGENIPVPYRIALKVGQLIESIKNGGTLSIKSKGLEIDEKITDYLENLQYKRLIPSNREITLYYDTKRNFILIFIFGGTKVNRLLRDLIKYYIQQYYPALRIKTYSTPYYIVITEENNFLGGDIVLIIERLFERIEKYLDYKILKKIALESGTLLWRIYQVAQRFGAINISSQQRITRRLLEAFIDTPIGIEAFNEVLHKDYDLEGLKHVIKDLREGSIHIKTVVDGEEYIEVIREAFEYMGKSGFREIKPYNREKYLERILNRRITLICINCGYRVSGKVKKLYNMESYYCPKCGLHTLAPVKTDGSRELEVIKKYRNRERLNRDEKRILNDLRRRALLLMEFGRKALLILSSPGVGVQEAIRIINASRTGADIIEEIFKSGKKYLRIKKYLK